MCSMYVFIKLFLSRQVLLKCLYQARKCERSCICVLVISSFCLSKIFGTVLTVWYFPIILISRPPFCNIAVCSDPPTVPNAVFSLELAETEIFQYNCSAGFNLIGDNAIQCQHDANWTNIMFTCTSKYQCTPTNNYLYTCIEIIYHITFCCN